MRYQKYQVIAAWANEVTMALKPLGITTKTTRGLLITTITAGIIGVIIMIALVTQVTRLTKRMRRVRKTLDLRMSKKKQAEEDNTKYKALEERIRKEEPNPYNSYTSNPKRNRKEIIEIRDQIGVWKQQEEKYNENEKRKQQEKEKQAKADREGALNIITQNMRLKT